MPPPLSPNIPLLKDPQWVPTVHVTLVRHLRPPPLKSGLVYGFPISTAALDSPFPHPSSTGRPSSAPAHWLPLKVKLMSYYFQKAFPDYFPGVSLSKLCTSMTAPLFDNWLYYKMLIIFKKVSLVLLLHKTENVFKSENGFMRNPSN